VRKKERSPIRRHKLENLSSSPLEKEDKSDLRIKHILTLSKANPSQRMSGRHSYKDRSLLNQWIPKGD